jgi:hypothetical protein
MRKKCAPRKAKGGIFEDIKKPKGRAIVNKMEKGGVKVDDIKKPKGRAIVNKMSTGGPHEEDVTVGSAATTDGGSTQDNSNGGGKGGEKGGEKGGGISAAALASSIKGLGAGADVIANVGGKKKKTGKDVVSSATGMMGAGAGIGSIAGPIGTAIGAGAGLAVGFGVGAIDKAITNKKIAKATAKAKAELVDSYSKSLINAKLASTTSYSLDQSKLNGVSLGDIVNDKQLTDQAKGNYEGFMANGGVKVDDIKKPKGRAIVNGMKDGGSKKPFKEWYKNTNKNYNSTSDYNLEDAYNELPLETMEAWRKNPEKNHLPDTYKKPNHPTFSVESKYFKNQLETPAGVWKENTFIPVKTGLLNAKTNSKGGEVVGAGGPKEDKVAAKIPNGSFVVPAENAHIAKGIRALVLGDSATKKAAVNTTESDKNVKLSNKEHVFTPKEVKAITAKGIDLNELAPNAKTKLDNGIQKLAEGGTKKNSPSEFKKQKEDEVKADFKSLTDYQFVMKHKITKSNFKANGFTINAKDNQNYLNMVDDSVKNKKTEKQETKALNKKVEIKPKELSSWDKVKNKIYTAKSIKEKESYLRMLESLPGENTNGRKSNKQLEAIRIAAYHIRSEKTKINSNQINDKLSDENAKINRNELNHLKKYQEYKKQYNAYLKNPENYTEDQLNKINDLGAEAIKNWGRKELPSDVDNEIKGKEAWLKNYATTKLVDRKRISAPNNVVANTILPKTAVPAGNPNIPTVKLDANGNPVPVTATPKTQGTTGGKRLAKKGTAPKRETFEPMKPITIGSQSDAIDKGLKELVPTAAPAKSTFEMPKEEPKKVTFASISDALGGPAGMASLGQMAVGLIHSETNQRPLDHVSPELMLAYKDAIATKTELSNEADYGLGEKVKVSAKNEIEANRLQAMNDIVAVTSGQGANASLRQLAQDKNKAVVGLEIADAETKLKKKQIAMAAGEQVGNLANAIDQRRRKIFEDDFTDYQQNAAASADLINAGLTNFVNNLAYQKGEKDRAEREAKYGIIQVSVPDPSKAGTEKQTG